MTRDLIMNENMRYQIMVRVRNQEMGNKESYCSGHMAIPGFCCQSMVCITYHESRVCTGCFAHNICMYVEKVTLSYPYAVHVCVTDNKCWKSLYPIHESDIFSCCMVFYIHVYLLYPSQWGPLTDKLPRSAFADKITVHN